MTSTEIAAASTTASRMAPVSVAPLTSRACGAAAVSCFTEYTSCPLRQRGQKREVGRQDAAPGGRAGHFVEQRIQPFHLPDEQGNVVLWRRVARAGRQAGAFRRAIERPDDLVCERFGVALRNDRRVNVVREHVEKAVSIR